MKQPTGIGIIGCGNISAAYFNAGKEFPNMKFTCCADLNMAAAKTTAETNNIEAVTVKEILQRKNVEIILNLTTPQAHVPVNLAALDADKHVYCEKPFALNLQDTQKVQKLATQKKLRTGCAPDTFLGGGHQTCRKLIDDGWLGKVLNGTAFMQCKGHEYWHPAPEFYYQHGGGPVLDMGPYYITALINMLGPVKKVIGATSRGWDKRPVYSQPLRGKIMNVEVNTHAAGILQFVSGALISIVMSFDVAHAGLPPIQLHGTEGSLNVPDPNAFGGSIGYCHRGNAQWDEVPFTHGYLDNMRSIGLADMAKAINTSRDHRCSGELASHVLEVMLALDGARNDGAIVEIKSSCNRPAPLPIGLANGDLD